VKPDELVAKYLPPDVAVKWRKKDWAPAHAIVHPRTKKRRMYSPYPDEPFKALVFLHEVAHFQMNQFNHKRPNYEEEYEAEIMAMAIWRVEGHRVPRAYLTEAKRYVRECIQTQRKKNVKYVYRGRVVKFKPHILRWARK